MDNCISVVQESLLRKQKRDTMTQLTNKQKKEWARVLFLRENMAQQEIADKVGISRRSLSKWMREGKWEEMKVGLTLTKDEQIQNLYRQIAEINGAIALREAGKRFASTAEADTIGKISAAIKKLEGDIGIADYVAVGIKFIEFIRRMDLDKAKEVTTLWDAFIREQM